jgi:hypothetical protein
VRRRLAVVVLSTCAALVLGPLLLHRQAAPRRLAVGPTATFTLPSLSLPSVPGLSPTTTAAPAPTTTAAAVTVVPPTSTLAPTADTATSVPDTTTTSLTVAAVAGPDTAPTIPGPSVPSGTAPAARRSQPTQAVVATAVIEPASVTGAYGLGLAAVGLFALVLIAFTSRLIHGGQPMSTQQRRWRLVAGVLSLGLAAVVGIVGYLRLSLEPAVNRQIPYLASAGMALVLLAAVGASLIVADQLRADDHRIDELEAAVRRLADALAPSIESPPRRQPARAAAKKVAVGPAGKGAPGA